MYIWSMQSHQFLNGSIKTIVLKLLRENERMYGYELTQYVQKLSKGKIRLTEGALYPTLHKMVAEGLLETEVVQIGKRKRKYYSLTAKGKVASKTKLAEFEAFVTSLLKVLDIDIKHA